MLKLADSWVWDFWLVDDGDTYHLFFLFASRALHDPDARHYRASVGHAVSDDLTNWTRIDDALVRGDVGSFDELATWTGSVVRHPDGTWFMFYTGTRLEGDKNVQSVGYATSQDLVTWTKNPTNPVVEAESRWYEVLADGEWREEAFRDPYVFADPSGDGWHMLVTARSNHGAVDDRGVIGHAVSADLLSWELRPPLSEPGLGFGQLEVFQHVEVAGQSFLLFNVMANDLSASRRATSGTGGIWAAQAEGPLGPFDVENAYEITDDSLYVGKVIHERASGDPLFLAFRNLDGEGNFLGEITDPLPVGVEHGRLSVPGFRESLIS